MNATNNRYNYVKEKLLNINGEYIKFYVTTNDKLSSLLANNGAAIIYHENSTGINYLYVAGELISSGYGLKDIESRDNIQWWADSYADELANLHEADNNTYNFAYTSYINTKQWAKDTFVSTYGGNISYTYINANPNIISTNTDKISTSNVLALTEQIEYQDVTFENVDFLVQYRLPNTDTGSNFKYRAFSLTNGDYINLPIGSVVHSISIQIHVRLHDSGSANFVTIMFKNGVHDNINMMVSTNNNELSSAQNEVLQRKIFVKDNEVISTNDYLEMYNLGIASISNQQILKFNDATNEISPDNEYFSINVSFDDPNNRLVITENNNNIIDDIVIRFNKTPKDKYKSFTFNSNIKSLLNALSDNRRKSCKQIYNIDNDKYLLNIHGVHNMYLLYKSGVQLWRRAYEDDLEKQAAYKNAITLNNEYYNLLGAFDSDTNTFGGCQIKDIFDIYASSNISVINYDYINDRFMINLEGQSNIYTIFFAIPDKYDISRIYYVSSDNEQAEIDITGYFIYCGNAKNNNIELFKNESISYKQTTNYKIYYCYAVDDNNPIKSCNMIVELHKSAEQSETSECLHIDVCEHQQIFVNTEFTNHHWYDAPTTVIRSNGDDIDNVIDEGNRDDVAFEILQQYLQRINQY